MPKSQRNTLYISWKKQIGGKKKKNIRGIEKADSLTPHNIFYTKA